MLLLVSVSRGCPTILYLISRLVEVVARIGCPTIFYISVILTVDNFSVIVQYLISHVRTDDNEVL